MSLEGRLGGVGEGAGQRGEGGRERARTILNVERSLTCCMSEFFLYSPVL